MGGRSGRPDLLQYLGDAHHAEDDLRAAHDALHHALGILTELVHPHADRLRAELAVRSTPRQPNSGAEVLAPRRP
ncbi:hypothetical protein [Streptomyces sulfonofaciens]|uniref:hypothetical protein n=1 Tax=Streptomyces sulfonofaciens TaxID=68272 RepID=UPI0016771A78|nr:hypothetical protein [Streptomyces sulfonofaciens]